MSPEKKRDREKYDGGMAVQDGVARGSDLSDGLCSRAVELGLFNKIRTPLISASFTSRLSLSRLLVSVSRSSFCGLPSLYEGALRQ